MSESESDALPLGDTPIFRTDGIIAHLLGFVNRKMKKYVCDACGWEYDEALGDPDNGIAPGTKFEDLPDDFECPLCGVGKDMFSEAE